MRPLLYFLAVFILTIQTAAPSYATTVPYVCPDNTRVDVEFSTNHNTFGANIERACAGHQGTPGQEGGGGGNSEPTGEWQWTGYICDNGGICNSSLLCEDGTPQLTFDFVEPDGTVTGHMNSCPDDPDIPSQPPTPGDIATAFREVKPPTSKLSVQPPGGKTLVNLDTIFSTEAKRFSSGKMKFLEEHTIEFDVFPVGYEWNFGDETEPRTTDWPGAPWTDRANVKELITHVYTTTDSVESTVTVIWGAKASIDNAPWVDVDATVQTTSEPVELDVLEAKPQLVVR